MQAMIAFGIDVLKFFEEDFQIFQDVSFSRVQRHKLFDVLGQSFRVKIVGDNRAAFVIESGVFPIQLMEHFLHVGRYNRQFT